MQIHRRCQNVSLSIGSRILHRIRVRIATPNHQFFSIQVPHFFLGHRLRANFHRGRQTLLRSVEEPMSTVICVLHPPCSQRGLGLQSMSQCSCQQTKYLWSLFRADRIPALQTKKFRTKPTRLDTRQFRRSRLRDAPPPIIFFATFSRARLKIQRTVR